MSKLSFRARALDASKPMPIFMAEELPDLPDYSAINRAVPQMPSGMEKEEECEHHLQRAICAGLIIPTPEVSDIPDKDVHDKLYPANYKQPRQLIHMQPFTMEQDIPDYDMDSEDERWLELQAKKLDLNPLKFEEMMDRLEKSSGQTVVTIQEAKSLLKEDDDLIIAVFDYWLNKRLKLQHPLILAVKTEHRTGTAVNNPYLAFRRRTEKMQTRKNRKNDETSYEKMLKLRRDLSRAVTLLELVKKREKMKREFVHLTVEVFEKRYQAKDFSGAIVAEVAALKASRPAFTPIFHNHYTNQSWNNKAILKDEVIPRKEKRQYKKRKHKSLGHNRVGGLSSGGGVMDSMGGAFSSDEEPIAATASSEPEEAEDEGLFAFHRNKNCTYHSPLASEGNWMWCSKDENGQADKRFRYTLGSLGHPRRCVGFVRRRMGRGGRVILDRLSKDIDFWQDMDYTVYDSSKPADKHTKREEAVIGGGSATNTFTNLDLVGNGLIRTDTVNKAEGVARTSVCADSSDKCVIKKEPVAAAGEELALLPPADNKEHEQLGEFWRSVQRDWLHFRPKTPPACASPPPCHLLPADDNIFLPSANSPFSLELRALDDCVGSILTEPSFMSSPFLLDYDISLEVPVTDTRQPLNTLNNHQQQQRQCSAAAMCNTDSVEVIGCSRFSVRDDGAISAGETIAASAVQAAPAKRLMQCLYEAASTVTSPKLNSSAANSAPSLDQCIRPLGSVRPHHQHSSSPATNAAAANGLVTQFGIEVPSGNKARHNKIHSGGYSNAVGGSNLQQNTISLLTSARTVTLNSHSANILEIPMSNDTDNGKGVGVDPPGPTPSPNNNQSKTIVRKSNLVMEVT